MVHVSIEWLRENHPDADRLIAAYRASLDGEAKGTRGPVHTRFVMNETEARFARLLDAGGWIEPIEEWEFETETLIITPDMTLTVDFVIRLAGGGTDCVDVKGAHTFEDSVVKGKAASIVFPHRRFFLAQWTRAVWRVRRVGVAGRKTIKLGA